MIKRKYNCSKGKLTISLSRFPSLMVGELRLKKSFVFFLWQRSKILGQLCAPSSESIRRYTMSEGYFLLRLKLG